MSWVAELSTTGKTTPAATPEARVVSSSATEIGSPSRYRSVRASSPSTMPSTSWSCTLCSRSTRSSGMGPHVRVPPS